MAKRNGKRRAWTSEHVRTLKALARKRTPAGKIARSLKRTEGATRQKAFSLGHSTVRASLGHTSKRGYPALADMKAKWQRKER